MIDVQTGSKTDRQTDCDTSRKRGLHTIQTTATFSVRPRGRLRRIFHVYKARRIINPNASRRIFFLSSINYLSIDLSRNKKAKKKPYLPDPTERQSEIRCLTFEAEHDMNRVMLKGVWSPLTGVRRAYRVRIMTTGASPFP